MEKTYSLDFLGSFFRLFDATIKKYYLTDNKIFGTVGWNGEEETQDFCWSIESDNDFLLNTKVLCDYLVDNSLVQGDRIIVSEDELLSKLIRSGWTNNKGVQAIDHLSSIEVKMVDDGVETDSFFIHF